MDLWEESWISVTELTEDLRAEARQLEMELFAPAADRRRRRGLYAASIRRAATVQRQERERDAQQLRARLRDRAPPPSIRPLGSGADG